MTDDLTQIVTLSLQVSGAALVVSAIVGIPLGAWLGLAQFPLRRIAIALVYTGMGLPPVVVGLVVYLLLSQQGPLGALSWLFTPNAMILAQIIIALPLVAGLTMSAVLSIDPQLRPQLFTLGATRLQATLTILNQTRGAVVIALVAGFGAIISEVGAVMLVGGNIAGSTRVLTTAIVLETRQGDFDRAIALGIILLGITFVLNLAVALTQGAWLRAKS